jgi:orotate phosphoribosyltransferase
MNPVEISYDDARARLLQLMRELAFERRAVTLSSGKASDFYIDTKQAVLTAEGHFLVGSLLLAAIERHAPRVAAIGGLTMGADPLASAVSLVSHLAGRPRAAFYVRKEPKSHGTAAYLEGTRSLRPGMAVAILEDVITTGASALKAIERARLFGLEVAGVFAVVDRDEEGGRAALAREAPVVSLFSRSDFI